MQYEDSRVNIILYLIENNLCLCQIKFTGVIACKFEAFTLLTRGIQKYFLE